MWHFWTSSVTSQKGNPRVFFCRRPPPPPARPRRACCSSYRKQRGAKSDTASNLRRQRSTTKVAHVCLAPSTAATCRRRRRQPRRSSAVIAYVLDFKGCTEALFESFVLRPLHISSPHDRAQTSTQTAFCSTSAVTTRSHRPIFLSNPSLHRSRPFLAGIEGSRGQAKPCSRSRC